MNMYCHVSYTCCVYFPVYSVRFWRSTEAVGMWADLSPLCSKQIESKGSWRKSKEGIGMLNSRTPHRYSFMVKNFKEFLCSSSLFSITSVVAWRCEVWELWYNQLRSPEECSAQIHISLCYHMCCCIQRGAEENREASLGVSKRSGSRQGPSLPCQSLWTSYCSTHAQQRWAPVPCMVEVLHIGSGICVQSEKELQCSRDNSHYIFCVDSAGGSGNLYCHCI